jgi:hypothetical protein
MDLGVHVQVRIPSRIKCILALNHAPSRVSLDPNRRGRENLPRLESRTWNPGLGAVLRNPAIRNDVSASTLPGWS